MAHSPHYSQQLDLSEANSLLATADTGPLTRLRIPHHVVGKLLDDNPPLQRVTTSREGLSDFRYVLTLLDGMTNRNHCMSDYEIR